MNASRRWRNATMLAAGLWLFLSPFVLEYGGTPARNSHLVGAALAAFALVALVRPALWMGWLELVLGLWLTASAVALAGEGSAAYWNLLVVGIAVVLDGLAAVFLRSPRRATPG